MRKHWQSVTIGAASVLVTIASRSLDAQLSRSDSTRTLIDAAIGLTIGGPADVNQRPLCDELNLPCNTPRTFPDFGVALQLAVHATSLVAVVAEVSDYTNLWDTVGVGRSAKRENNTVGLLVGARAMTPVFYFTLKDTVGIVLFAQLLGGSESSAVVPTRFALQPGIGVQGQLSHPGFWFRESFDYRRTRGGPRNLSGPRFTFALVVAR
jgi:hypothetical protein